MHTKPFNEINKDDAEIAGGKGASLGEMTQAGIPVPPGFVVVASAFDFFLKETDLNVEIDAILGSVNHEAMHTIDEASEKIKALILNAETPKEIADEVVERFGDMGAAFVAVRSSATSEDSADAAWAGQLETYLNTTGENLLKNVKKCWASLFTPRAIFYRFEKGLHGKPISVAVVVQKMVQSDVSGITFTVHPVTQDKNQMIIEAGWGLGEYIVGGIVTPDSYVYDKADETILDINVSEQEKMLTKAGDSSVPEDIKTSQKLSAEQIVELAGICSSVEKHYGFPCDIEWAMEGEEFFITQSRPITTLG